MHTYLTIQPFTSLLYRSGQQFFAVLSLLAAADDERADRSYRCTRSSSATLLLPLTPCGYHHHHHHHFHYQRVHLTITITITAAFFFFFFFFIIIAIWCGDPVR